MIAIEQGLCKQDTPIADGHEARCFTCASSISWHQDAGERQCDAFGSEHNFKGRLIAFGCKSAASGLWMSAWVPPHDSKTVQGPAMHANLIDGESGFLRSNMQQRRRKLRKNVLL